MSEAQEKAREALLAAANKASGNAVGELTVNIPQLIEACGKESPYLKQTLENHHARVNHSKLNCLVNRKQLIEELEEKPKPKAAAAPTK